MKKNSVPHREKKCNHDNIDQEIKNKRRKSVKIEKLAKTKNFMEISRNLIGYVTSFLSISECFDFIKLNNRSREIIMKTHKPFFFYIQLKKKKSLTFEKVFSRGSYKKIYSSELDVFQSEILGDQLKEKETEILLRDFLYSITNVEYFCIFDEDEKLGNYIKLLFSHPKCRISGLTCRSVSPNIYSLIGDILPNSRSIKYLELEKFKFTKKNLDILKLPLEKNTSLTNIFITTDRSDISYDSVEEYNDCLSLFLNTCNNGSSVKELILLGIKIDKKLSLSFSDFIKVNKTIKDLALLNSDFSDASDIFHDAFRHNNTLESIDFSGSNFNEDVLDNLVQDLIFTKNKEKNKYLPIVSNLKNIHFEDCNLDKEKIKQVCHIVKENPNIVELNLSDNKLHGHGFTSIISLIKYHKNLKKLDLSSGKLKDIDFKRICEALLLNDTLESVNLYDNLFSPSKNQIVELFNVNKTLKEFKIDGREMKFIEEIISERKEALTAIKYN